MKHEYSKINNKCLISRHIKMQVGSVGKNWLQAFMDVQEKNRCISYFCGGEFFWSLSNIDNKFQ